MLFTSTLLKREEKETKRRKHIDKVFSISNVLSHPKVKSFLWQCSGVVCHSSKVYWVEKGEERKGEREEGTRGQEVTERQIELE